MLITKFMYQHYDYESFSFLQGNRKINDLHLKQLVTSMQENGILFNVIIVNENMEIIDGQHRYLAQKQLKAPIFYVMVLGYGLREVQVLNTETSNWKLPDYLDSYINVDNEYQKAYQVVEWFKTKFDWGYSDIICCLAGGYTSGSHYTEGFKLGKYEVNHLSLSTKYAEQLIEMNLPFHKKASFLRAAIKMFRTKCYDHAHFIKRLAYKGSDLLVGASYNDYIDLLEKIYNRRTEPQDKIRIGVE